MIRTIRLLATPGWRSSLQSNITGPACQSRVVSEKMRSLGFSSLLLVLCGCSSDKERFDRDMQQRYEAQCEKYYSIYDSGDIESAKKALTNVIALSVVERDKAKYYWR